MAMVVGFGFLIWGADRFVEGASAAAKYFGVAPLLVGLTIVGFGTSAPELLVSSVAALGGSSGISVGNAVGSNIANASLVLGAAALVAPIPVRPVLLRREIPVLIAVMAGASALLLDGYLSRLDGGLLLGGLLALFLWIAAVAIRQNDSNRKPEQNEEAIKDVPDAPAPIQTPDLPVADLAEYSRDSEVTTALESLRPAQSDITIGSALMWLLVGFVALLVSARVVVWGAVEVASSLGVAEVVVGLTVVALGTSLPELAATVVSAWKRQHDLAFGNVIGSNFFNTLGVLGLPGVLAPGRVEAEIFDRDFPVMLGVACLGWLLSWKFGLRSPALGRISGLLLVASYLAYIGFIAQGA